MKTSIKLFLASFLMVGVLASCITCNKPFQEPRDRTEECGFDDEANIEQTKEIDHKISPAANRNAKPTLDEENPPETGAFTNNSAKDESGLDDSKIKRSRKHSKIGSTKRKQIKDAITEYKEAKKRGGGSLPLISLIILAIFIPPLAVGLYEGITGRFWLVLILWLLGGALGFGFLYYFHGLVLVAIILALLIVLGVW